MGEIKQAHELLSPMLGSTIASTLFAVALIASGQSSTVTGTLAGQIVMEGYLRLRINPLMRRLITRLVAIIPAIVVIAIFGEDEVDSLLIFSQVVLSLQLGFAVIPLIHFTSDRKTMGDFAIKPIIKILAWLVASVLVYLNVKMVTEEAAGYFSSSESITGKIIIIIAGLLFVTLLIYSIMYPLISKQKNPLSIQMHPDMESIGQMQIPVYSRIAVALDFSDNDSKLLAAAIGQSKGETEFILIHIVESASAILLGDQTAKKIRNGLTFMLTNCGRKDTNPKASSASGKAPGKLLESLHRKMRICWWLVHTGTPD